MLKLSKTLTGLVAAAVIAASAAVRVLAASGDPTRVDRRKAFPTTLPERSPSPFSIRPEIGLPPRFPPGTVRGLEPAEAPGLPRPRAGSAFSSREAAGTKCASMLSRPTAALRAYVALRWPDGSPR